MEFHIVKYSNVDVLSPWYEISDSDIIVTPEWKFYKYQLRTW